MHERGYIDYHAHRFDERSVIVFLGEEPVAVFPANLDGDLVISHGGLTYGGLVSTPALRSARTLGALEALAVHYGSLGARRLLYKAVPHVFHRSPSEEDLYALFRLGARLVRRDLSSVAIPGQRLRLSKGRKWSINKAKKTVLKTGRGHDFRRFHEVLSRRAEQAGRRLTHSVDELEILVSRFPDNIILHEAWGSSGELLAGVLVYDFGPSVHTQYIGSTEEGRRLGALDLLLTNLIESVYVGKQYFSFGISTERAGQVLNDGLIAQKESFSARGIVHDFYELDLP